MGVRKFCHCMSYYFRHWVIMSCVQYMWPLVPSGFLKLHQRLLLKTPKKLAILLSQVKTKQFSHNLENLQTYLELQSARIMMSCLGLGFIVEVGVGC